MAAPPATADAPREEAAGATVAEPVLVGAGPEDSPDAASAPPAAAAPAAAAAATPVDSTPEDDPFLLRPSTAAAPAEADAGVREEIPEPPADLTREDLRLRAALVEYYSSRGHHDRAIAVDTIVRKFRGGGVSHLWAQFAGKYALKPAQVLEGLSRTLYCSAPLDCDSEVKGDLQRSVDQLKLHGEDNVFDRALNLESSEVLAALVCGSTLDAKLREESRLVRARIWRVLLGYLPIDRRAEWDVILAAQRARYMDHRKRLLDAADDDISVASSADAQVPAGETEQKDELLTLLRLRVDEALRGAAGREEANQGEASCGDLLQNPATRRALLALLFVFAELHPAIRYVQGMGEVALVVLYVMRSEPSADDAEAEADAFWCFEAIMAALLRRLTESFDATTGAIHASVGTGSGSILSKYDPELAKHLVANELEPGIFALRWYTTLFASEMPLPAVARLWDSLLADPDRFQLCDHACVAAVIVQRWELLATTGVVPLAELVEAAPRQAFAQEEARGTRIAWAIYTLERRAPKPPFPPLTAAAVVQEVASAFFTGVLKRF